VFEVSAVGLSRSVEGVCASADPVARIIKAANTIDPTSGLTIVGFNCVLFIVLSSVFCINDSSGFLR
jgi:hypothetical protein